MGEQAAYGNGRHCGAELSRLLHGSGDDVGGVVAALSLCESGGGGATALGGSRRRRGGGGGGGAMDDSGDCAAAPLPWAVGRLLAWCVLLRREVWCEGAGVGLGSV
eukprot:366428-Chlamydomonas_euryale.AAC.3